MNLLVRWLGSAQGRRVLVTAVASCLLLTLPACANLPLRLADQTASVPASFNGATSPDSIAQLGFAEFYDDPLLTQLIDQALVENRELKVLNEEIEIAANEVLARRGAYLPFVSFEAGAELRKPSQFTPEGTVEEQLEYRPGKFYPDPLPNLRTGFNLFWQLDIWRELRNARDAAAHRYASAVEGRNFFVTRLVAEIAEHYFVLMALDQRLATLDQTIELQEQSLRSAIAKKEAARGTELAVQRFQAEVRKNQSEKLLVNQEIVEAENRINFLVNRFPQRVERRATGFYDLNVQALRVGLPAQLLQNRPDIRRAERDVAAAGLDVKVARAHFLPRVDLTARVGYEAFTPKFLFYTPESLVYGVAGSFVAPLLNRKAIQAEYLSANARQLESVYDYQRVILNAFTEVVNRMSAVENYQRSIQIKREQLQSLEASVDSATKLFLNARAEYVEVLLAQRDLLEARTVLIETKRQQLIAIVQTYQALGGGDAFSRCNAGTPVGVQPAAQQALLAAPAAPRRPEKPAEDLPAPRPVEPMKDPGKEPAGPGPAGRVAD